MAGLDDNWGGSLRISFGFKGRRRLLPSLRQLVAELCSEYLEPGETAQQLVLAVQELLENLVKYSDASPSALTFELLLLDGEPSARISTQNRGGDADLCQARDLLERVIAAPEPESLMHSLVAASGEREGSQLGLARLRAESGLRLSYGLEHGCLRIEACCAVQPRGTR